MASRDIVLQSASHSGANAVISIMLAGYVAVAVWNGQFPALVSAARDDFIGGNGHPGMWRWMLAIIILYALASNSRTSFLFGPLLVMVVIAMLIELATTQPGTLQNLMSSWSYIFNPNPGAKSG